MRWVASVFFFSYCMVFGTGVVLSQEAGKILTKTGSIDDDLYLAGSKVHVIAKVNGDVVVSGGEVTIEDHVAGDVFVAGGTVSLHAKVDDDVRLTGGKLRIRGEIGGDLLATGGEVWLAEDTLINGKAWIAGGQVEIAGHVLGNLQVVGGNVVISAVVDGDAEVTAGHVELRPGAVVKGDFVYRSQNQAVIDPAARIAGSVQHGAPDFWPQFKFVKMVGIGLILALLAGLLICVLIAGLLVYLLFPAFFEAVANIVRNDWLSCLGFGFVIFISVPVLILILFLTIVGIPLALLSLVLYGLLWLLSALIGVYLIGDQGLRWLGKMPPVSSVVRVLSIVVAFLVIAFIEAIPFLGALFIFLLTLAGFGALYLHVFRRSVV